MPNIVSLPLPDFYKAGRSLTQGGNPSEGELNADLAAGGGNAAGDPLQLFIGQLRELLVQGFDILFEGVQFVFRFHYRSFLSM